MVWEVHAYYVGMKESVSLASASFAAKNKTSTKMNQLLGDFKGHNDYEGCSNMNASSFKTFFTYMLRQNVIPFWKELFLAFQMAPNIKKHSLFFSSYRPLYKGRSSILKFFWIKLQHTFWYLCGYSVISLLIWDKMTTNFSCKSK